MNEGWLQDEVHVAGRFRREVCSRSRFEDSGETRWVPQAIDPQEQALEQLSTSDGTTQTCRET